MECFSLRYLLAAFLLYHHALAAKLPSYITACKRSSPDLSKCFKETFESLGSHLTSGISEFKISPTSKLVVPSINMGQIKSSSVDAFLEAKNVKFTGLDKYEVLEANINLDEPSLSYKLHFKEVILDSNNVAKGKAMGMTFDGEPHLRGVNKDMTITCGWKGEKFSKGGKDHIKWKIDSQKATVPEFESEIKGLFNNHPEMDESFNRLFNENPDAVRPDVEFFVAAVMCGTYTAFQNQVFDLLSIEDLFP